MDVKIPQNILDDPYAGKELLEYLKHNFGLSREDYDSLKHNNLSEIKSALSDRYNFID